MMKFSGRAARRQAAGCCLLAGLAVTTITAPTAFAAPDCSAAGVAGTGSSVTGSANQYLGSHPGANAVVTKDIPAGSTVVGENRIIKRVRQSGGKTMASQ